MKKAISIMLLGLAAGCTTTEAPAPAQPVRLSASDVRAVKSGVVNSLRDPSSAVFGGISAGANKDGIVTVCGWVNARNGFGGMTGMMPFVGLMTPTGGFAMAQLGTPDTAEGIITVCARRGAAI